MGWGDEMLAAGEAKRLHEAMGRPIGITDRRGSIRWHAAWEGLPYIVNPARFVPRGWASLPNYSGHRPYCQPNLSAAEGYRWTGWKVSEHRPVLALSAAELELGRKWRAELGPFVMCDPIGNPAKFVNRAWGAERFKWVRERLPDVPFVYCAPDARLTPPGFQHIPTADFRKAAGVLSGAALYLGNQGGLVHAAAALGVRSVVIFGGVEPPDLMGYPENRNIADPAQRPACGRILPCDHCKAVLASITPDAVAIGVAFALAQGMQKAGAA